MVWQRLRVGVGFGLLVLWWGFALGFMPYGQSMPSSPPQLGPLAQGMPSLAGLRYLRTRWMILQPPFSGDFPLTNGFDHDRPHQVESPGLFISLLGDRAIPNPDHPCGKSDGHAGYDWQMAPGTPILAAAEGWITHAGLEPPTYCPLFDRAVQGIWVGISHRIPGVRPERYLSLYTHLSQVLVQEGQWVRGGEVIGLSGNTGCSTGPHLHFEILRLTQTPTGGPTPVDPYGWRGEEPDPWAEHPQGAVSQVLWRPHQAPPLQGCDPQQDEQ